MEQITGNVKYQYNHTRKRQAKFKVGGTYYALPYGKVKRVADGQSVEMLYKFRNGRGR